MLYQESLETPTMNLPSEIHKASLGFDKNNRLYSTEKTIYKYKYIKLTIFYKTYKIYWIDLSIYFLCDIKKYCNNTSKINLICLIVLILIFFIQDICTSIFTILNAPNFFYNLMYVHLLIMSSCSDVLIRNSIICNRKFQPKVPNSRNMLGTRSFSNQHLATLLWAWVMLRILSQTWIPRVRLVV